MSCKNREERLQEYKETHNLIQNTTPTFQQLQNQLKIAKAVNQSAASRMDAMTESMRLMQLKMSAMHTRIYRLEDMLRVTKLHREVSKI